MSAHLLSPGVPRRTYTEGQIFTYHTGIKKNKVSLFRQKRDSYMESLNSCVMFNHDFRPQRALRALHKLLPDGWWGHRHNCWGLADPEIHRMGLGRIYESPEYELQLETGMDTSLVSVLNSQQSLKSFLSSSCSVLKPYQTLCERHGL